MVKRARGGQEIQNVQRTLKFIRKQRSHFGIDSNRISNSAADLVKKNNLSISE